MGPCVPPWHQTYRDCLNSLRTDICMFLLSPRSLAFVFYILSPRSLAFVCYILSPRSLVICMIYTITKVTGICMLCSITKVTGICILYTITKVLGIFHFSLKICTVLWVFFFVYFLFYKNFFSTELCVLVFNFPPLFSPLSIKRYLEIQSSSTFLSEKRVTSNLAEKAVPLVWNHSWVLVLFISKK